MSNNAAKIAKPRGAHAAQPVKTGAPSERRQKARSAPSFPSRKGEQRVDGLTRSELVLKYGNKVKCIAGQIAHRLPSWVEVDDLVGVGFIGLMDAADKFDASRGVKFDTYAGIRIRGAMLDELRNQDWVPRTARDKAKAMEAASDKLTAKNGRAPSDAEMSQELGVSIEDFEKYQRNIGALQMVSFADADRVAEDDYQEQQVGGSLENTKASDGNPFIEVSRKDTQAAIEDLLRQLPDQERIVLSCYYFRGLSLKEIGQIMGLSDARISQIHSAAIRRLKDQVNGQRDRSPSNEALMLMLLDME